MSAIRSLFAELAELIVMSGAVAVFQGDAISWSDKGRKALDRCTVPGFRHPVPGTK